MLSIEKALSLYTDRINSGALTRTDDFEYEMNPDDYIEFLALAEFIDFNLQVDEQKRIENIFQSLHKYKNSLYDVPSVSSFRSSDGSIDENVNKRLDELFDEEFNDD